MSEYYRAQKINQLVDVLNKPPNDIMKLVTLGPETLKAEDVGKRRVGQPRANWLKKALEDY